MTYGLVAIVKQEAANIGCFLAAAKPYISAATICDTGSSDDTVEGIVAAGYEAHRVEWVNFGQARSAAFALARNTATWILALDADMTVEIDPDFEPDPALDCYMIRMECGGWEYRLPLLLRGDVEWKSVGAVHEYTARVDGQAYTSAPTDKVRVTMHGGDRSSREKSLWHASLLEAELATQPDNARDVYYLAQTRMDLGEIATARDLYLRRTTMGGFEEERWHASYRAAHLAPDWPARATELMASWQQRPSRLEPLCALLREMNSLGLHEAAYRLSGVAVAPTADLLFVEVPCYTWKVPFEKSIAAWRVGRKDECRELCDALLDMALPQHIREQVERNLAFCE